MQPIFIIIASVLLLSGCSQQGLLGNPLLTNDPNALFTISQKAFERNRFDVAIRALEKLETQFPFSTFSDKVKLNLAYARFKSHKSKLAIVTLNQYLTEKPFSIEAPYAWYLRGLSYQEWSYGTFTALSGNINRSEFNLASLKAAHDNFSKIVRDYPDSPYSLDSAYRMKIIKEQLAESEVTIGKYYFRRKAFLSAINRGYFNLTTYNGASSNLQALQLIHDSYTELGLHEKAQDIQKIISLNFPKQDTQDTQGIANQN